MGHLRTRRRDRSTGASYPKSTYGAEEVNSLKNDRARHSHVRAVVAYPAVTVALVVSVALALTSFGPSQISALAATPTQPATYPQ